MKKNSAVVLLLLLFTAAYVVPTVTFANGGDQRVVDGKYLINLSRAPFTPRVGVKTSLLASFVDIQKDKLIAEDLMVKVRITKLGGGKREFLFEKENLMVKGGVLELAYTFAQTGLHEVFFDFAFASNPDTVYEAPDFLIDVQEQEKPAPIPSPWLLSIGIGITGVLIGFALSKMKMSKPNI